MIRTTPIIALLSLLAAGLISNRPLLAQQYPSVERRQFPLNQMSPPGLASQMAISARRITKPYFQPVRVLLPGSESVDVESS
ncbi:MAG: hypothetical protein FJ267_04740, partial [Planctomycetes bacterium]|nr:hypothetical protein [Planctomycetota bacterium]